MACQLLDRRAYGKLLAKEAPTTIQDDAEHASAIDRLTELARKQERATPEELEFMKLLVMLIEDYEQKRWPRKREKMTPAETLAYLMEESGTTQSDLGDIAPQPNISAILSGRRQISKAVAIKLGKRFHVSPELFL